MPVKLDDTPGVTKADVQATQQLKQQVEQTKAEERRAEEERKKNQPQVVQAVSGRPGQPDVVLVKWPNGNLSAGTTSDFGNDNQNIAAQADKVIDDTINQQPADSRAVEQAQAQAQKAGLDEDLRAYAEQNRVKIDVPQGYDFAGTRRIIERYPDFTPVQLGDSSNLDAWTYGGGLIDRTGKFYSGYGPSKPVQRLYLTAPDRAGNEIDRAESGVSDAIGERNAAKDAVKAATTTVRNAARYAAKYDKAVANTNAPKNELWALGDAIIPFVGSVHSGAMDVAEWLLGSSAPLGSRARTSAQNALVFKAMGMMEGDKKKSDVLTRISDSSFTAMENAYGGKSGVPLQVYRGSIMVGSMLAAPAVLLGELGLQAAGYGASKVGRAVYDVQNRLSGKSSKTLEQSVVSDIAYAPKFISSMLYNPELPVESLMTTAGLAIGIGAKPVGGMIRTAGKKYIPIEKIGYNPKAGYPTSSKITRASLTKSFEESTLYPYPERMSGGNVKKVPYVPESTALPGEVAGKVRMWTAWESSPVNPTGKFTLMKGASEVSGMYGAPVAESYFAKVAGGQMPKLGGGADLFRRPSLVRTTLEGGIQAVPRKYRGNYEKMDAWITANKKGGRGYMPLSKVEYETVLPAGNVLKMTGSKYYTKVGGVSLFGKRIFSNRLPIVETTTTGELVDIVSSAAKKTGSKSSKSVSYSPYKGDTINIVPYAAFGGVISNVKINKLFQNTNVDKIGSRKASEPSRASGASGSRASSGGRVSISSLLDYNPSSKTSQKSSSKTSKSSSAASLESLISSKSSGGSSKGVISSLTPSGKSSSGKSSSGSSGSSRGYGDDSSSVISSRSYSSSGKSGSLPPFEYSDDSWKKKRKKGALVRTKERWTYPVDRILKDVMVRGDINVPISPGIDVKLNTRKIAGSRSAKKSKKKGFDPIKFLGG